MTSYTLSCAKSNGTIHFVLSLKFGEPIRFSVASQKPYIFYATSFLYIILKIGLQILLFQEKLYLFCLNHFSLG